jgi:hypothetical protein
MKIIRKFFWVWQFEKEEKWLNDMAKQGKILSSETKFCKYVFEDCEPGEYEVRMVFIDKPMHEADEYIQLLKETGAEKIGKSYGKHYFRRKSSLGEFTLFSDIDSRISYINTLLVQCFISLGCIAYPLHLINNKTNEILYFCTAPPLIIFTFITLYGLACLLGIRSRLKKERTLHE